VPLTSVHLVQALADAGLPAGVLNLVLGRSADVGDALAGSEFDALTFTGSNEIGRRLQLRAVERGKKVQLELGGKNPAIVLADADLDLAADQVARGAFLAAGQKCTATSRVIVEDAIYDKFLAALIERTKKLKIGDGMQPGVEIGPLVDQAQMDTVLKYIEIGKKEAGAPKAGGNRLAGDGLAKGYFVEPTIFADVDERMTIAQEEIFGPVLAVMRAKNFDDAMRIANNIPFGLSASIQTTNLSRVFDYVYKMEAGLLTVNLPSAGVEYQLPFGGTKDSSFGPKEQGPAALEFYSDYKTVYLKY